VVSSSPQQEGFTNTDIAPISVNWSPDGRYIAVNATTPGSLQIFNATNPASPTEVGSAVTGANPFSVNWSPDGRYIAVVNFDSNSLQIFNAFNFPVNNNIKENTVEFTTTSAPSYKNGIGLSGSSNANLIVENTAYNNYPLQYAFVTNVFNAVYNTVPTVLQNIAITQ